MGVSDGIPQLIVLVINILSNVSIPKCVTMQGNSNAVITSAASSMVWPCKIRTDENPLAKITLKIGVDGKLPKVDRNNDGLMR